MQKITPFLWFDGQAEDAALFYVSVFKSVLKKGKIESISRYDAASAEAAGRPKGSAMVVEFELAGQRFLALNGGPEFKFSPATSFLIECKTQHEIDAFWDLLTADGGKPNQCGWLDDKYGLSWQVVPAALPKYLGGADRAGAARAMRAMLGMQKMDIAALKKAYEGK